jgi:5-methyltetrahydrofolate--homocysteine methyltransferase
LDVAKKQVEDGAHVMDIDVVDGGMLDGLSAIQKFVKIAVTEPEIAKVPFMMDASKFEIVLAGLKWCQGKQTHCQFDIIEGWGRDVHER